MIKKLQGIYRSGAASRTAINTMLIYSQKFLTAGLALITTPLILNALGIVNFGIYTLTLSFVMMLAFLNWSLSSVTQRYIGIAIGEGNTDRLKKIFSTSFLIHLFYGVIILACITTIGFFFADQLLNIPEGKLQDTRIVLIIVGFISFLTIIAIPLLGVLRANENFFAITVVGITESLLKLGIAISLIFVDGDKLILYAFLLLGIAVVVFILYLSIVTRNYKNIQVSAKHYDKNLVKEMMAFLSWSFLGALAIMSRNQGVQVLINTFFGVVRNAAYGVAMQVNAAMAILSQGLVGSISPQIIKSAGAGDIPRMIYLMRTMSKFAIFSVSLIAIPLYFECTAIMEIWLKKVPAGTIEYVRLIILFGLIQLLSAGIQTVFDALGKVKLYNIWVSVILILNLPVSYIFFKLGYPSYSIIIVGMVLELLSLMVRLQLLKKYVQFSVRDFYYDTLFRVALPTIITGAIVYLLTLVSLNMYIEVVLAFLVTIMIYPLIIYNFSLEKNQKEMLMGIINKLVKVKKN